MTIAKGWAIDQKSWHRVFHVARGAEWKRVSLHADNRSRVPDGPGIYVMCVATRDLNLHGKLFENLMSAIYVGQATSLKARFAQHVRGDRPGLKEAVITFRNISFYYALMDKGLLSHAEQCLIDALGPSVNAINATRAKEGGEIKAQLRDGVLLGKRVA